MQTNYRGYLQKRILLPLAAVISTTAIVFVVIIAWHIDDGIRHDAEVNAHVAATVYQSDIETDIGMILPIIEMIQLDEKIRDAFMRRDREALLRLTAPLYEHLNEKHHISHFYFSNPERINLLRVHNPSRHGDEINRHTTLEAARTGQPSYGLELGTVGTFTLRVVVPWYHEDRLIGYLELGEEIDHVIAKLRELLKLDIYVFIRKDLLDAPKFKEMTEMLGRQLSWERYPDYLLVSAPREEATIPPILEEMLRTEESLSFNQQIDVVAPERHYKATFLPLHDVMQQQVGALLLLDSTERWYLLGFKTLSLSVLLLAIVGGSVFLFFLRLARSTEKTLDNSQKKLLAEDTKIRESNRTLTKTKEHLRLSLNRLREAQRIALIGSWEWDITKNQLYWSAEVYRIFGLPESHDPLSYERFLDIIPEPQRSSVDHEVQHALSNGGFYEVEHPIILPDHSLRLVHERAEVFLENGKAVRMVGTVHDVTEERRKEEKMEQLGHIFDNASNEIYLIDAKTYDIMQANHTAITHLDYSSKELERLCYLEIAPELGMEHFRELVSPLHTGARQEIEFTTIHHRKSGEEYPVEVRLQLSVMHNSEIYIAIVLDISERIAQQHELHHRTMHDPLTNLPNRYHLMTHLEQEVARAQRNSDPLALILFDINSLGDINDTIGHDKGDQLLLEFSQRLTDTVRETDTVARISGDEFCLLLPDVSMETYSHVIDNVMHSLNLPFATDTFSLILECSIGIAIYPDHASSANELIQHADVALKRAKKNGIEMEIYDPEHDPSSVRSLVLNSHMRNAVNNNELRLYYQPKVESKTGQVIEAEALLRWQHPEQGLISPAEFIPLAERTGFIKQLTLWVIHEALQQQALWQAEGFRLRVGVNLSARNLLDPDLLTYIIRQVQESGLKHECLSFEVTESAMMRDPDYTISVLNDLNSLGHRIAIDDYGTGYSSLAYLQRLPVDELKIDSSFIFPMLQDEDSAIIVRSTIAMAHNLGKSVTAEGVETAQLVEKLSALKCDLLQGYHFSKPLPANDFIDWLRKYQET